MLQADEVAREQGDVLAVEGDLRERAAGLGRVLNTGGGTESLPTGASAFLGHSGYPASQGPPRRSGQGWMGHRAERTQEGWTAWTGAGPLLDTGQQCPEGKCKGPGVGAAEEGTTKAAAGSRRVDSLAEGSAFGVCDGKPRPRGWREAGSRGQRHVPSTGRGGLQARRRGTLSRARKRPQGDPALVWIRWHRPPGGRGCPEAGRRWCGGTGALLVCMQGPAQSCFPGTDPGARCCCPGPLQGKEGCRGPPCANRPQGHPARRRGPAGQCPQPPAPLLAPSDPSPRQLPSRAVLGTPSMDWLLQAPPCPP